MNAVNVNAHPPFFYVRPSMEDCARLPMGTEFDCVFAPEATTGDGWHLVCFRVTEFRRAWRDAPIRGYTVVSKTPLCVETVEALWQARRHGGAA